jgi:tellurite resistance protein TerC
LIDKKNKDVFFTLFWVLLAILFGLSIMLYRPQEDVINFFSVYLVEKTLSIDNMMVFSIIFTKLELNYQDQKKVLWYGILGAIIMRFVMIFLGTVVIRRFSWLFIVFGLILIFTGIHAITDHFKKKKSPKELPLWLKKFFFYFSQNKLSDKQKFFLAIFLVEMADLIFAIDSIPAAFAITTDIFLVYTANLFAILGLRSLYLSIVKFSKDIKYLQLGLSLILIFIGIKMVFAIKVQPIISFIFIITVLFTSFIISKRTQKNVPR